MKRSLRVTCALSFLIVSFTVAAQTNIAAAGKAYAWAHNAAAASNANRTAAPGLNDGNSSIDVNLSGGAQETAKLFEAAGVVWPGLETIGEVQFINGTWSKGNDGGFCANLTLQVTDDGTTWTPLSWTVSPRYAFDTNAVSGVKYTFAGGPLAVRGVRISGQAHCSGGNSDWANVREVLAFTTSGSTDTTPPTAPNGLTANAPSPGQVSLSWTASTDNVGVSKYQVFRNGGSAPIGQSTITSYHDISAAANTTYSYVVTAMDSAGNVSAPSNAVQVTTPATETSIAGAGTAYTWAHNASATVDSNRTAAPGLNDGNTGVDVDLSGGSPETATLFEAAGVIWSSFETIGRVQFVNGTWSSGSDGGFCASLTLQVTSDGTTWTPVGWAVSPSYAYDTSGVSGVTYTFSGTPIPVLGIRISGQAHCPGGNSDWAYVREVLAFGTSGPPDTTPPTAPGSLSASATSQARVSLTWTASTDNVAIAGYLVYRNGSQIGSVSGSVLSYEDVGLAPGTTYGYTVKARDAAGNLSLPSNTATATTPAGGACIPDITIPTAAGRSWPDSCSTGASDSLGTLKDVTGDIILDTPNQLYANMRINGTLTLLACGITVENVEVDAGEPFTGDATTQDLFPIWVKQPPDCSVTLDHVSVITKAAPNNYATNAIRVAYGGPVTITNTKIIGTQLGITTGPGLIRDNYAVLGATLRGDHNEVILEDGTSNLTIEHNTFLNPNLQTAVLSLFTEFGNNQNIMVDNNLLGGGGYTCYCGDGRSDNAGNPARAVNVSFENNVFWRLYYPDVGFYASGRAYNSAGGGQWLGNLYMNADGTLTTQAVPAPPIDQ